MPVHPEITSATVRESTQTGTIGSSSWMASKPFSRRLSCSVWLTRSSSSVLGGSTPSWMINRRKANISFTACRSAVSFSVNWSCLLFSPAKSFCKGWISFFRSNPVATLCWTNRNCASQSAICCSTSSNTWGFPACPTATLAQAVSNTLMALSGNCLPVM